MKQLLPSVALLVAVVTLVTCRSTGKIVPILYSFNATFNPAIVNGTIEFEIERGRKAYKIFNINLCSLKVVNEAWMHASFSVMNKKGNIHAPIYDSKVDFCDFIHRPYKYHLLSLVYNEMRRFGHIPPRCPIMPRCYVYSNISMRQIQLPSFLSEAEFHAEVVGYRPGKEQYMRVEFRGELKKM